MIFLHNSIWLRKKYILHNRDLQKQKILTKMNKNQTEWADIAISSGGSTPWELAFMGLPAFVICFAENQIKTMDSLHNYGSVINLGWYSAIKKEQLLIQMNNLLQEELLRKKMSEKGTNLIDGSGRKRIIDNMNSYN